MSAGESAIVEKALLCLSCDASENSIAMRKASEARDDVAMQKREFQIVGGAFEITELGDAELLVFQFLGMHEGQIEEGAQGGFEPTVEAALDRGTRNRQSLCIARKGARIASDRLWDSH